MLEHECKAEQLLLSVGEDPNWGMMAISLEGMFVYQEKAKLQISLPQRDTYKACACPRANPSQNQYSKGYCYSNHSQAYSLFLLYVLCPRQIYTV